MNRKIKFRAWQKYHKQMLDVTNIGFRDGEIYSLTVEYTEGTIPRFVTYSKDDDKFWLDDDCIKLMQYTGLKDKNDKEIYEGDILSGGKKYDKCYGTPIIKIGNYDECKELFDEDFCELSYTGVYFEFNDNTFAGIDYTCISNFEVIGNIYENPELLEIENNQ